MASLFDTTIGQQVEFLTALDSAGFTAAELLQVVENPALASRMHAAIQHEPHEVGMPSWHVSPERQLERARALWPSAVLPEPPKAFHPRTSTEVLLLHVPDTLENLWSKVVAPDRYAKSDWDSFEANRLGMCLTRRVHMYARSVWIAFDPEHGRGEMPCKFWNNADLAASEVISALIQFPEWPLAWRKDASVPFMAGYQLDSEYSSSLTPYVDRSDRNIHGGKNVLRLGVTHSDVGIDNHSCPSAREY